MNGAVVHLMNHSELLGPLRLLFPENISMRKAREVAINEHHYLSYVGPLSLRERVVLYLEKQEKMK